jgi:hypothetical protein
MGRTTIHTATGSWRERLLWMSFAIALIALMLLGLLAIAELGEPLRRPPVHATHSGE